MKLEVETEGLRRLGIVAIGMAVYLLWYGIALAGAPGTIERLFVSLFCTGLTGVVLFVAYGLVYWIAEGFGKNTDFLDLF